MLHALLAAVFLTAAPAAAANPCPNGSFERLVPKGEFATNYVRTER